MMRMGRLALLSAVFSLLLAAAASPGIAADTISGPFVGPAAIPHATVPLRSLPTAKAPSVPVKIRPRHNPLGYLPDHGLRGTGETVTSPGFHRSASAGNRTPDPIANFEGQGNSCGGCSPPDTVGDVGPNHYVQLVNATAVAVYDKSGNLAAGFPKQMNALFASGNCAVSTEGDPVVLYDSLADRWLLAQFSTGNGVCVAVSQTPDPTGAYFGYEFLTPEFPDYLKFGVWSDGYYMSTNESTYAAYAFDRTKMLAGQVATQIRFSGISNFMLPADVDGPTPPPAGAPAWFYTFKDNSFHSAPSDQLEVYSFHSDFSTPGNSTFTLTDTIPISPFTYTVCGFFQLDCIPQGGTAQKVDPVSEWPMFRFAYRNFGTRQSAVGNFTVRSQTPGAGAIRWFELRKTTGNWSLFQEGTLDSNDGVSRWMGSIAMDAFGNIALGYSVSSAALPPGIRYAVHMASDVLGTMQAEKTLIAGGGSQTASNRWGDYSAMSVDPSDDATFWFTSEYYPASAGSDWHTRIGSFRVQNKMVFTSQGPNDGNILELTETSTSGGTMFPVSPSMKLGDDAKDRQWRAILDFNTARLPDNAVITSAFLELTPTGATEGTSPFTTHKPLRFDIRTGVFGGSKSLQLADFNAVPSLDAAGYVSPVPVGTVLRGIVKAAGLPLISKTWRTQFRLRFNLGDNDDNSADTISFATGDAAAGKPKLTVLYTLP